jgi:glutamyl-tRNA synthetase
MRNFLALLGWSPGGDREIIPEPELIQLFSLEGIQSKPAVFDVAKLEWMNGQYLSLTPADQLLEPVRRQLARNDVADGGRDLRPIIDAVKSRSRTIVQLAEQVAVRLDRSRVRFDAKGEQLVRKMGPQFRQSLELAGRTFDRIPPGQWSAEHLLEVLKATAEQSGLKLGDLLQPIRVVLTGSTVSEPVNELLAVVGREESIGRLADYLRDAAA